MQLHQTAAQGLSLFLLVTVIQINPSLQLINHTTLLGYASLSTFFPAEVHIDEVDYFPKTLNFKHLIYRIQRHIKRCFYTVHYPSQCNDEYTDFN